MQPLYSSIESAVTAAVTDCAAAAAGGKNDEDDEEDDDDRTAIQESLWSVICWMTDVNIRILVSNNTESWSDMVVIGPCR